MNKARKVLGVEKSNAGVSWFYLHVDGAKTETPHETDVTWVVDKDATETTAVIHRKYEMFLNKKTLKVARVKITGPQAQINTLLLALGRSTPEVLDTRLQVVQSNENEEE